MKLQSSVVGLQGIEVVIRHVLIKNFQNSVSAKDPDLIFNSSSLLPAVTDSDPNILYLRSNGASSQLLKHSNSKWTAWSHEEENINSFCEMLTDEVSVWERCSKEWRIRRRLQWKLSYLEIDNQAKLLAKGRYHQGGTELLTDRMFYW